jgi:putative tricarboxylic transport membrane protein
VIVGVIPGLGGSVVDWIAYGFTVQSAKDKSKFGQGDVRGVIGPESSNNAKEGGGLVPTLIFGIPGSGSMAVFLGGIALLGYDPGPHMVRHNLDITYTIVWSLALANVFGAGLCIILSGQIAKITTIRFTLVAPFLFMMIAFAAFQSSQSLADLLALLLIGCIGIFLRRFEWSRPAFLIGFVLSSQAESFANQAVQIGTIQFRRDFWQGMEYIFSPVTIGILILLIVSVVIGLRQGKHIMAGSSTPPTGGKRAPLVFLLVVTAYVAIAVYDASTITVLRDKIFPVTVGIVTLIACAALLVQMMQRPETDVVFADLERGGEDGAAPHGLWPTLGWFAFLLGLSALLGFILALGIFLISFLRIRAGVSWARALILTAAGLAVLIFLGGTLGRDFPPGLLQEYLNLPWPLT